MKRLDTLLGVVFWTDIENFRRVQDFLKNEQGFVNALGWDPRYKDEYWFDDCLVYQEDGEGVYRTSFHRKNAEGPCFEFKYWDNRLTDEQKGRDPMRLVVLAIYEMLKPVRVTDYNLEEVLIE